MVNFAQKKKNAQKSAIEERGVKNNLLLVGGGIIVLLLIFGFRSPTVINNIEQKPIFEYVSSTNDLESETEVLKTTDETTYHTFNFNTNTIALMAPDDNGNWKTFKYRFTDYRSLSNGVMEFDVDHPACSQVWVDAMGSIGYELTNGQTLVFYDVQKR